jgi:hypothetical protein
MDMREERWGQALNLLVEAIRYQRAALKGNPQNASYRQNLRDHLSNLATTNLALRNTAEAARAAREIASLGPGYAGPYNGACYLARCVPLADDPSDASRYADEAFAMLKRAVAAGWAGAAHTATDPDLAPLRERDDFRQLLGELFDRIFPADPFARGQIDAARPRGLDRPPAR